MAARIWKRLAIWEPAPWLGSYAAVALLAAMVTAGGALAASPPIDRSAPGPVQERRPLGPYQGDLGHPYFLPQATRAQLHECAETWQQMKLSGAADNLTWRIYATGCLNAARKSATSAPSDAR